MLKSSAHERQKSGVGRPRERDEHVADMLRASSLLNLDLNKIQRQKVPISYSDDTISHINYY